MSNQEIDPKTKQALEGLRSVLPRDPMRAARGKAEFLKQAAGMRLAVSREKGNRHNRQSNSIFPVFPRKERAPVFNTLSAIVLTLVVLFSGTATTVYASQSSLPDQTLYPVKIWSENAILSLHNDPQTQIQYNLDFSDRRITEMARLLSNGSTIPEEVMARLQNELDQALQLAAGMDSAQMRQQLEQIRQRAERQLQKTNSLMIDAPQSEQALLRRAQACIQEQAQLAGLGESDPEGFRMQIQQRHRYRGGSGEQTPASGGNGNGPAGGYTHTGTPAQNGPGSGNEQPTGTPGHNGPGSQSPDNTPQPGGGGNSPGP